MNPKKMEFNLEEMEKARNFWLMFSAIFLICGFIFITLGQMKIWLWTPDYGNFVIGVGVFFLGISLTYEYISARIRRGY